MNSFTKLTITALLAASSSVVGLAMDSTKLSAKISFPFRAFTADLPAGSYEILKENENGIPRFYLSNRETRKRIVLLAHAEGNLTPARPSLVFRCTEATCGLTKITDGDGRSYQTVSPKYTRAEKERLVTVYLNRTAAD